jgi:hypothetical protein
MMAGVIRSGNISPKQLSARLARQMAGRFENSFLYISDRESKYSRRAKKRRTILKRRGWRGSELAISILATAACSVLRQSAAALLSLSLRVPSRSSHWCLHGLIEVP